jgi:hypothetical protein
MPAARLTAATDLEEETDGPAEAESEALPVVPRRRPAKRSEATERGIAWTGKRMSRA